jgi:peptidoglycan/LPS O-acetylase OafA/YrhL
MAVLSVFVFHFDRHLLTGGFVGVDIFFVISGFLITSILLNDIDQGHLSITRFYQRRIARIAPAFFVVLVTTLGFGALIYSAQDFASLGANSVAAALSIINIKLLFQGSYFKISPDAQPLIHYWSLAVEEQYYLIFPIYLYTVSRFTKRPLSITMTVCGVSFAACVVITPLNPIYAFYLLPTRAWELFAGSSLALFRRDGYVLASGPAWMAAWGGLGLLAVSFLLISDSSDFPGWIAACPVLGTVLVLASIEPGRGRVMGGILAHPLLVFIGKRSYSLYLWHWPVFSFIDYHFFDASMIFRTTCKILICIVTTLSTYHFVERPMRTYLNNRQRQTLAFRGFALAVIAVCVGGMEIRSRNYLSADSREIAAGGIMIEGSGRGTVVLIGDSQGAMYGAELASLARIHGFSLNVLSMAAAEGAGHPLACDRTIPC